MYEPEFCVRVEIQTTDVDSLRAWHVILAGQQRGGMAARHGYLHTEGPLVDAEFAEILTSVTDLLVAYAQGMTGGVQLTLE